MRDYRDGQTVQVVKNSGHQSPVYPQGMGRTADPEARASVEIGEAPVSVKWSGYYHQLRAEGAILVVE